MRGSLKLLSVAQLSEENRAAHGRLLSFLGERGTPTLTMEHANGGIVVTAATVAKRGRHMTAMTACASADTAGEALCAVARAMGVDL